MENNNASAKRMDPSKIIALSTAYWDSQTLLTANRMDLFTLLAAETKSLQQITNELGTNLKATRMLLNACIALGLLEVNDGLYKNSATSDAFLTRGQPGYLGDAIRYSDDLYDCWGKLQVAVQTGLPQMPAKMYTGEDEEQTRNFVYGMHNRAMGIGRMMTDLVDLSGRTKMIDIGGGPGTYSVLFAKRNPELKCKVLDLPGVLKISEEIIQSMGATAQVTTQPLNYMQEDFPDSNDVVLISGVFHRETEETCRGFIRRAYEALDSGGMLVVSDVFTDAGRTGPLFATLFGLNMMLTAEDGEVHADDDVASWMQWQNFHSIKKIPFPVPMPHRIVLGIK